MLFDLGSISERVAERYDVITVGGGPSALAAAIYAKRMGLSILVIEKAIEGGQLNLTTTIDNYPGFSNIRGEELAAKMKDHARQLGAEFLNGVVTKIEKHDDYHTIMLQDGKAILANVILLAMGANPKKLNVPGEKEFTARGISYCATCDGYFFKDKHVMVIGGGDTAMNEALHLSKIAKSVTVVHRRDKLRAVKALQDKVFSNDAISFEWNGIVDRFEGSSQLEFVVLKNVKTGEKKRVKTDGVFVAIGLSPNSDIVRNIVKTDENGYILTDENTETSVPRIYAVGDVRKKSLRQIVTAVADGALAIANAFEKYFA